MDIQALLCTTPAPDPLEPPPTPQALTQRQYAPELTRTDRIRIKAALDFGILDSQISDKYGYTLTQIQWAKRCSRLTPQKKGRVGKKPVISTPKRARLEQWLLDSPSRRRICYTHIPAIAPELNLQTYGHQALQTAFKRLGYRRRIAKRKGFSTEQDVIDERFDFALVAKTWSPARLYRQIFSDEVWASGGAHTQSYITVKEDGSERFALDTLQHKYTKLPAWMFHRTIIAGQKGPALFWEKAWGSMNSKKYDQKILARIQSFLNENQGSGYV
jgi:hypothetical protein